MVTRKNYIRSEWKSYLYDIAFQTFVFSKAYPEYTIIPYLMLVDTSKKATVDGMNQLIKINRDTSNQIIITHAHPELTKADLGDEILIKIPVQDLVDLIWSGNDINPSKKGEEEKKGFHQRIQEYSNYCVANKKYPITIGTKCKGCEFRVSSSDLSKEEKNGFVECWKTALNWDDTQFLKPSVLDIWNYRRTQNY
jgi:hypothetical protein